MVVQPLPTISLANSSPFQLEIMASVREQPQRATWLVVHVTRSSRSRTDAVICNRKGIQCGNVRLRVFPRKAEVQYTVSNRRVSWEQHVSESREHLISYNNFKVWLKCTLFFELYRFVSFLKGFLTSSGSFAIVLRLHGVKSWAKNVSSGTFFISKTNKKT